MKTNALEKQGDDFLLGKIAHELRNPLNVIKTSVFNIRRKTKDPNLESHLVNIEKKIAESECVLKNLLHYARPQVPQPEDIPIVTFLNTNIDNWRAKYPRQKILIRMNARCSKKDTLHADLMHMNDLVFNILDNAYQSYPEGPRRIQLSADSDLKQNRFNLVITDKGEGIEKNILANVFDPFFTTKTRGVGLGLTVCRQFIELHGGKIQIQSKKGKGTTVSLTLPLRKEE